MKKIKQLPLLLFIFLISFNINSQESPEDIIAKFFNDYTEKGAKIAVAEIYATNPWASRIQDAINNVQTQFSRFDEELVGKYHGYEFLTKKTLGKSYALYSYFIKFDRQFLRLTFQFYKPKDKWRVYSFKFDDDYDDEIEEAAKAYYLKLGGN